MFSTMNYDSQNEYYNIIKKFDSFGQASFKATRVQPILKRPQDYEIAVVRFNIPASLLPIFFWKDDKLGNSIYIATLEYDSVLYSRNLEFIPNEPVGKELYGKKTIFTYQEFLDSLNNAYANILNDINTAIAPAPPLTTVPPVFTYDAKSTLFSYYVDPSFYSIDTTSGSLTTPDIKIFMNEDLYFLFGTLRNIETSDPVARNQLIPTSIFNRQVTINAQLYDVIVQDTTTTSLWNTLFSIEFETNTIPVNPELLPTQQNIIRSVLTDFEPRAGEFSREAIQYQPQGALRFYDLNSSYPLNSIDLVIWWVDTDNIRYPLYVSKNDLFSVKLRFRKKGNIYVDD